MSANPSQFLLQLHQTAPLSAALALSGQGITQQQFKEILNVLPRFAQLNELDFSNNGITSIDGIEQLKLLARLDLGGNPLPSRDFLRIFSSLPALRHLTVPLASVEDETLFVKQLTQLLSLNGYEIASGPNGDRVLQKPKSSNQSGPLGLDQPSVPPPDINLVGADLEPVATLFDAVRNLLPPDALASTNPRDEPFVKRRHVDCRLDTFESHINHTVVSLNESLARPPYSTSSILRNAAILRAKHQLFDICAQALTSHARVIQPAMAECFTQLRAAEAGVMAKYTELLTWLDSEFELLSRQVNASADQSSSVRHANESLQQQLIDEKSRLIARSESEAALHAIQLAKVNQRLDVERESSSKEKKALSTLVETLDAEVAEAKAAVTRATENERTLRRQMEEREKYWLDRDAAWSARLKQSQMAPPLDYHGLGQVIGAANMAANKTPQPQPNQQPSTTESNNANANGTPTPDFSQPMQPPAQHTSPAQQQQQQYDQTPSSTVAHELSQAFFPSSSPNLTVSVGSTSGDSAFSDPRSSSGGPYSHPHGGFSSSPFTATNALMPSHIPSAHFHPSTTSQALTLHQQAGQMQLHPQQQQPTTSAQQGRAMTLRQIKDLIREIYVSYDLVGRSLIDTHNVKLESQKETLLQHMYTFLNHKFGLKSLIMDAANSLIRGLNTYTNDHTVAVFGGILRHTLDEDFRCTEEKTKKSVRELLKVHIAQKNPLKRDNVLNGILEKKLKGTLNEEEYTEIVSYMFAPVDRVPITETIRSIIMQQNAQEEQLAAAQRGPNFANGKVAASTSPKGSKMAIKYTTFVNILLDFQLHVHRKFLEPFVTVFRMFDTLHSGLLSYDQFYKMVGLLNPNLNHDAIRGLIVQADPFKQNLIAFSDCVKVLGEELKQLAIKHHKQQQQQQHQHQPASTPYSHSHTAHTPYAGLMQPPYPADAFSTPHHQQQQQQAQGNAAYHMHGTAEPQRQPFHVHGN